MLICPKCKNNLIPDGKSYRCKSGHCYDVAKKGLSIFGVDVMETPKLLITENAYSCAMVALRKYDSGEFCTDSEIAATYLRLPQAERERIEKEKNGK